MRSLIRFGRLLVAAIIPVVAVLSLSQAAQVVPTKIKVPDGNKVFLVGHASGVQIYAFNTTASGFAWGFVAPRANLYANNGHLIVTHFAGPTWQAKDGSKVMGGSAIGVTVDDTAIPWLRLSAVSPTAGPNGDRLAHTTYIQRIATAGGLAPPAADCNAASAGTVAQVPYTADYYFW